MPDGTVDTFCSTPGCLQRCPHTATECIQGMGTTVTAIKRDPLASRAQTESDSKATFAVPKGQAKAILVDDLRGHAQWLMLKGYDHFAKQVYWAANIIEGLK